MIIAIPDHSCNLGRNPGECVATPRLIGALSGLRPLNTYAEKQAGGETGAAPKLKRRLGEAAALICIK